MNGSNRDCIAGDVGPDKASEPEDVVDSDTTDSTGTPVSTVVVATGDRCDGDRCDGEEVESEVRDIDGRQSGGLPLSPSTTAITAPPPPPPSVGQLPGGAGLDLVWGSILGPNTTMAAAAAAMYLDLLNPRTQFIWKQLQQQQQQQQQMMMHQRLQAVNEAMSSDSTKRGKNNLYLTDYNIGKSNM